MLALISAALMSLTAHPEAWPITLRHPLGGMAKV
jgi:hypothetical protein